MKKLHQILYESYRLLLEYDVEKTKKTHGEKALAVAMSRTDEHGDSYLRDVHGLHHGHVTNSRPGTNKEKAMHELFGQFEDADPTPNKKYVQHIARIYGHGGFNRHEDLFSRGTEALSKWDDLAKRKIMPAEHRDIGKIKSLSQMEDLIDEHGGKVSGKEANKEHHEQMKSQATITEHGGFTHIIPHTKEASHHFGKGTRWCTAAKNNNMHDHYAVNGPLQMFIPKEPKHEGEKYQYHYSSDQLMDEKDHSVGSTGHNDIDVHIGDYRRTADSAHQSTAGFDHPEGSVRRKTLAQHWDRATSDQVGKVVENGLYDHYTEDHFADAKPEMGKSPLLHPNVTDEHLHKVLEHPDFNVRSQVLYSKNLKQEHIDKCIKDAHYDPHEEHAEWGEMVEEAYKKTKNPEHFAQAFKTLNSTEESPHAIEGICRNPNTPPEMLSHLIKHPRHGWAAVANPKATDEDLKWVATNHARPNARENAKYFLGVRKQQADVARVKAAQSSVTFHTK